MSNEKYEFEILFRDIYPKLYYAAQQLVKDEEVCRDFISDSFLQLWSKRADIEPAKRAAFLYRIVHNKCIDFIRKDRQRRNTSSFTVLSMALPQKR